MTKSDLIKKISDNLHSFSREDTEKSVNAILKIISESLLISDRVEIRNFGTFSCRAREQRISRNPKTGTAVLVREKLHPYFRASKYLKESLNK